MHVIAETSRAIRARPSSTRVCSRLRRYYVIGTRPRCANRRTREFIAAAGGDQDVDELLQEDLKRLQQRQQKSEAMTGSAETNEGSSLQDIIDKALIADFFFILFALAWLGVGVGVKSSSGNTDILDAWLALWQWVFQPAIGVLMLGAIVSGFIGWLKKKKNM